MPKCIIQIISVSVANFFLVYSNICGAEMVRIIYVLIQLRGLRKHGCLFRNNGTKIKYSPTYYASLELIFVPGNTAVSVCTVGGAPPGGAP